MRPPAFSFDSMDLPPLTRASVQDAHKIIQPLIHRTPLLTSRSLSAGSEWPFLFKAENLQRGGAFKARGAFYNVSQLSEEELAKGVCTHSSGNHAGTLALAARERGSSAYIVMPDNSARPKIAAVEGYNGQVTFCPPTAADRQKTLDKIAESTGAIFIPPYDSVRTILGQGTIALEMEEQARELGMELGAIVAPVGGGGLLGGICVATKGTGIKVFGAEPLGADDCARSLDLGHRIADPPQPETIADGLRTPVGAINWPLINEGVEGVLTVSEEVSQSYICRDSRYSCRAASYTSRR